MTRGKRGISFITVLVISMIMIFVAVSASNMLLQDAHMVKHLKRFMQARYLGEAGISDAVAILLNQGFSAKDNPANFPEKNLAPGTFDVTVTESGGRVLLSSEGEVSGVPSTVSVEVKDLYPGSMYNAVAAGGNIDIKSVQGNITVKGDMHANGDMNLSEQGQATTFTVLAEPPATGKATATGSYSTSGNITIADAANSGGGRGTVTLPVINFAYLKEVAEDDGNYIDMAGGTKTFQDEAISGGSAGITYVEGNVKFKGSCTITGGFVASGDIFMANNNSLIQTHDTDNRFPIFISNDGMKLYGLFSTEEGNLVYATNSIMVQTTGGQSAVLGTVISGGWIHIVANNNITITYTKVIADEVTPEGIEIVSWNK